MDHTFSGAGSWSMIPTMPAHSNISAPTSQDHLFLQQQQIHQFQQQQQQLQHQQFQQQQQFRRLQQQHHHHSLASHFHLLHLMEGLTEAVEKGSSDQHSDALIGVKVNKLKNNFEKCQQLMVSIAESISSKAMVWISLESTSTLLKDS